MFELKNIPQDTSEESKKIMLKLLSEMEPSKKLSRIFDLSAFARSLIEAEMRQRKVYLTEMEFKKDLSCRLYGFEEGARIVEILELYE